MRAEVFQAAPETNIVLLRGQGTGLRFPPVCPNCELPASGVITVRRSFVFHVQSDGDTPNGSESVVNVLRVPFCHACVGLHRTQQRAPGSFTPLVRILREGEGWAGIFAVVICLLFLKSALKNFSLVPLGLGPGALALALWLVRSAWKTSPHLSVAAPTAVDQAVDFTPFLSLEYEPPWRAFQFRSSRYCEWFRQANAHQLWNPESGEAKAAQAAREKRSFHTAVIIGVLMAALSLWFWWHKNS